MGYYYRNAASYAGSRAGGYDDFCLSSRRKIFASGSFNHHFIWIWSLVDGRLLATWEYPEDLLDDGDRPYDLAFHPAGTLLFAACGGSGLRIWDLRQQREIRGRYNNLSPTRLKFAPDGRFLAIDGCLLDIDSWSVEHTFSGTNAAFSPDGRLLTTLDELTGVAVWDRETRHLLSTV